MKEGVDIVNKEKMISGVVIALLIATGVGIGLMLPSEIISKLIFADLLLSVAKLNFEIAKIKKEMRSLERWEV